MGFSEGERRERALEVLDALRQEHPGAPLEEIEEIIRSTGMFPEV